MCLVMPRRSLRHSLIAVVELERLIEFYNSAQSIHEGPHNAPHRQLDEDETR